MKKPLPPQLQSQPTDLAAAVWRALGGSVPGAGALVAELACSIIPNQRLDRIAIFAARTAEKLTELTGNLDDLEAQIRSLSDQKRALFQEGAAAAANALGQERIERIARLVAEGMTSTDETAELERQLVDLLSRLSDADLAVVHRRMFPEERTSPLAETESAPEVRPEDTLEQATRKIELDAIQRYRAKRLTQLGLFLEVLSTEEASSIGEDRVAVGKPTALAMVLMRRLGLGPVADRGAEGS